MSRRIALLSALMLAFAGARTAGQTAPASRPVPAGQAAPAGRGTPPTPPCGPNLPASIKNVAIDSRCFELRTYTVSAGSSIDTLHARFRDRTNRLFAVHGITVVGYWQPVTKPDTLVYLLAYKDAAARDAAWAAFNADPEWVKARTELQVNVRVESVFMSATDYSPIK